MIAIKALPGDLLAEKPERPPREQREDTPSPTPPPDDPFSTSSIDLVMGSPIQVASRMQPEEAPNAHDDPVSTSSIDLAMGSPSVTL